MKITFLLSSAGGSPLQVGLERGLNLLGHQVAYYDGNNGNRGDCDLMVVFNQCAHLTGYHYPRFPIDCPPLAFVDSAEYGYFKRLPAVAHQYQNTFSYGAMRHDTKNAFEQMQLKQFLDGRSFPYFMREYIKWLEWPTSYHPIDYPLYLHSEWHEKPNRGDYLDRPLDLYVRWGASHPWRRQLTEEMKRLKIKSDVSIIDEPIPRIPQGEFFRLTREARCSVSFDGYGSSSFRFTEALCRTLLVRGPLSIKLRDDLTDGVNCRDFKILADGEDFVRSTVGEAIMEVVGNPEKSFEIYERGYEHCHEHYTEKATAAYLLKTVEGHDWSKPTPLDL